MSKTTDNTPSEFAPLGDGLKFAVSQDGKTLLLAVPLDKAAGKPSQSGKMKLVGNTGGFATIPGTDGFRASVMVGFKV